MDAGERPGWDKALGGRPAYGLVESDAAAARLAQSWAVRVRGGQIFEGGFAAQGARVWGGSRGSQTD